MNTREITLQDAPTPAPEPDAQAEEITSLKAMVAELVERLSYVEATVGRLELLEKERGEAPRPAGVSAEYLQPIVKRVQELSGAVSNISSKLQGTLGYDIYHSFQCEDCGTKGLVAAVYKCTSCGHQSWRGWSPKK